MPKIPLKLSIEQLIQRVEASGSALGEKATALSEIISQVALRLQKMSGKTSVTVESEEGVELSFSRWNDWGLWLYDNESGTDQDGDRHPDDLTSVSMSRKARAFPLLLQLLPSIEAEQKRQLSEIDDALALLRAQQPALFVAGREGN
jgi:hypothetical protein